MHKEASRYVWAWPFDFVTFLTVGQSEDNNRRGSSHWEEELRDVFVGQSKSETGCQR